MRKYSLIAVLFCMSLFSCAKPQENNDVSSIKGDYINNRTETFDELSGWKFRVKVYGEKQTVADNGGETEFLKKADKLLSDVSKLFCVEGINDAGGNQMHFFMTDFAVFEGASGKFTKDADAEGEAEYDLRLVLNEHAMSSDDADGWYAAPYFSVGLSHKDGVFSSKAVKLLAKHLAASRGAYDLSASEVLNENANRINGSTYAAPSCIMNDPYKASAWSDYAKKAINASGEARLGKAHYELFPAGIKATVRNADGSVAKGAKLKFYPVYPGSGTVTTTPLYEGELSVTGNYIFKNNPFVVPGQSDQANNIVNYLVEINLDNFKGFTWMPMHEVTVQYIDSGLSGSFVYVIQMPDASEGEVIPEGDYIDRAKEFAKLPGWKYRCKIMGEAKTVEECGGRIPFMKKVDALMVEASKYFQVPGINDAGDNQVHFFMTDMVVFEGQSRNQMYDNTGASDSSYDLRIVFNAHSEDGDVAGGYLGSPYLCIGHNWSGDGGLWEGWGIDCLVHEMGHYRGMIDIYACELKGADNPINGQGYEGDYSIMNYHYGNKHWCEYSLAVINASAGDKVAVSNESTMPSKVEIKVLDKNGAVANGAVVKCYPVHAYSYKVESTPAYQGTISDNKPFEITSRPFWKSQTSSTRTDNYLVEVEYNGVKSYEWMPLYKAMTYVVTNNYTKTYPFTIQLK